MITLVAGAMLRRKVRRGLEVLKFENEIQVYLETKGFLESAFHIKGATQKAIRRMKCWTEQINKD